MFRLFLLPWHISAGVRLILTWLFDWVLLDYRGEYGIERFLFVLEAVANINLHPSALVEECVRAGPLERADHDDAEVDLVVGVLLGAVEVTVSAEAKGPGGELAFDEAVVGDGLQTLLVRVRSLKTLLVGFSIITLWLL